MTEQEKIDRKVRKMSQFQITKAKLKAEGYYLTALTREAARRQRSWSNRFGGK